MANAAHPDPQRVRTLQPAALTRRGELTAALGTAVVLAQLAFAQVTLVATVLLTLAGRLGRWRPGWLAAPALAGLAWTLAVGIKPALAGFAAGPRLVSAALAHPGQIAHLRAAVAAAPHWLSAQFPLALLTGSAQAWLLRHGWLADSLPVRPWLVAAMAGRWRRAELAAGHTATADGCALGVQPQTGKLAGFGWAAAEHGVLVTGSSGGALIQAVLPVTCAALRRRKTVLVVDLTGGRHVIEAVSALAAALGVPVSGPAELPGSGSRSALATEAGLAIRRRTVVLSRAEPGPAGPATPAHALGALAGLLSRLGDLGLRADCLTWIHGVGAADAELAAELIRLGSPAGTSVLVSTVNPAAAAALAGRVAVAVVAGQVDQDLAMRLAGYLLAETTGSQAGAGALIAMHAGDLAVLAPGQPMRQCSAVAIRIGDMR